MTQALASQLPGGAEAVGPPSRRVPVPVFVNNHFAGYAPATIEQREQVLPGTELPG